MNRIWEFSEWLPYEIDLKRLAGHCRFMNSEEVFYSRMRAGFWHSGSFPIPKLDLSLEDFSVDCFAWEAFTLVSEKMRSAMALSGEKVQYFPVDSTLSASLPRSKNYMIMHVPVTESISSGGVKGDFAGVNIYDVDIYKKTDHEIFCETKKRGLIFCQDSLALKVLSAGCTGVRFLDPRYRSLHGAMRFRTIRGIEEEGDWDPVAKIERTKVIELISS